MQQDSTTDMAQSQQPKPNARQQAALQHAPHQQAAFQHARQQHAHRLSVAPMMDWTDRHCRVFHRILAPHAALYTEMVTADAIIHGDRGRLLSGHHMPRNDMPERLLSGHDMASDDKTGDADQSDMVVLQLGGSDPEKLARAIGYAAPYHYAEYNLNVGCPSDRVQSGRFGACLMAEPHLVADCMAAMMDAAGGAPVTVKCRIGIDDMDPETGLYHFVETVAKSGVHHFIIHARKAWLNGLSPKENRTIPPLDYDRVIRLKQQFPDLKFSLNGGITRVEDAVDYAAIFHGVMIGRAAYQTPYILAQMAAEIYGHDAPDRMAVAMKMADYADQECAKGTKLIAITRHMLGLMHGLPGAKAWRRSLSEDARGDDASPDVIRHATEQLMTEINRRTLAA